MSDKVATLTAIPAIPMVQPGDDVAAILIQSLDAAGIRLGNQDVLVVAQKIVSKAEGRYVELGAVFPSERAQKIAKLVGKDPRLVEVILSESHEVIRCAPDVLIVAHRLGFVMANAGVDRSNVAQDKTERVLLLPKDPDVSAAAIKAQMDERFGVGVGVVINDSVGRAWRNGTMGMALGAAGLPALYDMIGRPDLFGRRLEVTQTGFADELASAASLLMGQADEGLPAVVISGLHWSAPATNARALQRPKERDLFR
jgi:coenzyme F420-0:L-glutamate ligase/coenzyme F420-1:gamma-L-glutamate ligase